ncbi:hypothetical protein [Actinophytocola glycyrrhizae]|uniref:Uncharacterized protein n=1 Tax=Actinophytocola glycyrrhizae TaxID=2044873 RepID=A0ABV9RZ64_9PSEU
MPIRTNRGRAAVYRRLWGWPMRSPRHLTVVVFVVAVLVITLGILVPQLTGGNKPGGGAAAESSGNTTSTSNVPGTTNTPGVTGSASALPTRITEVPSAPTSAPPDPAALEVADSWGRAWVDHPEGITAEEWLAELAPFTTEEQLTEMATVAPGNIGATEVTGEPEVVESFTSSVKVELPTDDGNLLITVIDTPDGWRVAFYEQVS